MTNESNTPDIDYALTLMDCWGRDENQSGPGGACRLAAQVIRFLRASPEPETLVVTKTFNEALKELTSGPYEPWQVTKLQLDHQQAEITQLREENQALRNLAQNLRPGPISEALVGASHEPLPGPQVFTGVVKMPKAGDICPGCGKAWMTSLDGGVWHECRTGGFGQALTAIGSEFMKSEGAQ